jgi:hypothetical protein
MKSSYSFDAVIVLEGEQDEAISPSFHSLSLLMEKKGISYSVPATTNAPAVIRFDLTELSDGTR